MTRVHLTLAEETETRLQDAARGGWPLLIPGAFEPRPDRSPVSSTDGMPRVYSGEERRAPADRARARLTLRHASDRYAADVGRRHTPRPTDAESRNSGTPCSSSLVEASGHGRSVSFSRVLSMIASRLLVMNSSSIEPAFLRAAVAIEEATR
jgi:hypothetical protein